MRDFEFGPGRDLFEGKGFGIRESEEESGTIDMDASILLGIGKELTDFAVKGQGRWRAKKKPDEGLQRVVALVDDDAMSNGGVAMSFMGEDKGWGIEDQRLPITCDHADVLKVLFVGGENAAGKQVERDPLLLGGLGMKSNQG